MESTICTPSDIIVRYDALPSLLQHYIDQKLSFRKPFVSFDWANSQKEIQQLDVWLTEAEEAIEKYGKRNRDPVQFG